MKTNKINCYFKKILTFLPFSEEDVALARTVKFESIEEKITQKWYLKFKELEVRQVSFSGHNNKYNAIFYAQEKRAIVKLEHELSENEKNINDDQVIFNSIGKTVIEIENEQLVIKTSLYDLEAIIKQFNIEDFNSILEKLFSKGIPKIEEKVIRLKENIQSWELTGNENYEK